MNKKNIESFSYQLLSIVAGLLTNLFYDEISDGNYKIQQVGQGVLIQQVHYYGVWQRILFVVFSFIVIWGLLVGFVFACRYVRSRVRYQKKKLITCEIIVSTFMEAKSTLLKIECAFSEKEQQRIIENSTFMLLYTSEIGRCITDLHRVFCGSSDRQKQIVKASFRTEGSYDFKERISPYEFIEVIIMCETLLNKIKSSNSSSIFMNDQKQLADKVKSLKTVCEVWEK